MAPGNKEIIQFSVMKKFTIEATVIFIVSLTIIATATIISLYINTLEWFLIRHTLYRLCDIFVVGSLLYPFSKGLVEMLNILFLGRAQYEFAFGDVPLAVMKTGSSTDA